MTGETAREISANSEVLKRLAKYIAQQCFRKTILEDLHAGITPDSQIGDYTDAALMIDVVNKTYHTLIVLFDDRLGGELIKILAQRDLLPHWNEPTLTTTG
jgi:hypothetical protein